MDFTEGYLKFSFADDWQVDKYDETREYRDGIGKLPGSKAIDFLGIRHKNLYLIEVKDFRNYRIDNERRMITGELTDEVGGKVRDSIAAITGTYCKQDETSCLYKYARFIINTGNSIKVIVWLEHDLPNYSLKREKVKNAITGQQFKRKLNWITNNVLVCSMNGSKSPPGLEVSNLSHSQ